MTLRGKIKNGQLVLDEPVALPEGTSVAVEVTPDPQPVSAHAQMLLRHAGTISDTPEDFSEQHDHYLYGTPKK